MGSSLPLLWYHLANWSKLVDLTNRFSNLAHLLYIPSSLAQCDSVTFVGVVNACACVPALEEAGVLMSRSFKVVVSQFLLWEIA